MKKIKYFLLTLGVLASICFVFAPNIVMAAGTDSISPACTGDAADTPICKQDAHDLAYYVGIIVNTLLIVLGAVAVVVIIIAGIIYTTSGGEPALIKRAKDTLLYAVVGLIVAISSYAIVNFVVGAFK